MGSRKVVPPTKPHFFKPFLPGSEHHLSIPDSFFKRLKSQDCDKVVLGDANGKFWHVKMVGRKLQDGWKEFASDHDLQVGDFLVFRHEGDLLFDVMVFDKSTCEREYTSTTIGQVDVKVENETLDQERGEEIFRGTSVKKSKVNTTFRGKAKSPVLKNPHFEVKVSSSNVTRDRMQMPMRFSKQNFLSNARCEILLVNQQGRSWTTKVKIYNNRHDRTYIGSGWSSFRSENNLKCGDSFIFELIEKGKKPLLKMHGLRKAKKEPRAEADHPTKKKLKSCDIKAASLSIGNTHFTAISQVDAKAENEPLNQDGASIKKSKAVTTFRGKTRSPVLKNPHFEVKMSSTNATRSRMHIPKKFARQNHLSNRQCEILLVNEWGRSWAAKLNYNISCAQTCIGSGWGSFCAENNLKCGDSFIFDLIAKGKMPVLKMRGLQKAKKKPKTEADSPTKKKLTTCDIKDASLSIRNPHFTAFLSRSKRYALTVPSEFAKMNGLTQKRRDMILEDERGKPWSMSLIPFPDRVRIGSGWCQFVKAKGLREGSAVTLELIRNGKKLVMRFHGNFRLPLSDTNFSLVSFYHFQVL